jgi:hypothetical protein
VRADVTLDEGSEYLLLHALPTVLTHNYHPARGAFRNVCCLPPNDAEEVIAAIRAEGAAYRKPDYLARRLWTETWLMAERARKLGEAPLTRPIYFFLGDMTDGWDQTRPVSVIVPLDIFDSSVLTFTYPDSMTSCPQSRSPGRAAKAYQGQVYTLSEIENVVRRYGFPDPKWPRNLRGTDSFIEVQVWDDRPLSQYRG